MTAKALRVLAAADVVSGLAVAIDAPWFSRHLGIGTGALRIAGAVLVLLGIGTLGLLRLPATARATVAVEGLAALLAVDLLLLADPTGVGAAILAVSALWCAAAAVVVGRRQRAHRLVAA